MIDELAEENPSLKIGKVNIDDNPGKSPLSMGSAASQRF